jgi:uncharacterized protein
MITVIKQDHQGRETWRYSGRMLERGDHYVILEAYFDREDTPIQGMLLRKGDRFVETYYDDRWYNIFEVYDRDDSRLKGWYCNIGKPAEFHDQTISYQDLALDLLVFPDGRQLILDEEEFAALPLDPQDRVQARAGVKELQARFTGQR